MALDWRRRMSAVADKATTASEAATRSWLPSEAMATG